MTLWRVLTHAQAETEYERMESQLLQMEGALLYLDRARSCGDAEWIRCATNVACLAAAQTSTRITTLSATPSQRLRYSNALTALNLHVAGLNSSGPPVLGEHPPEQPAVP